MSMASKIDGTAIAKSIREECKVSVDEMKAQYGVTPGLAVVLVGERRDSATYVRMKKKACMEIGIRSIGIDLPIDITEDEVINHVNTLNSDPSINGILVQLPLPDHINEQAVLDCISQDKDVDGLHPLNVAQIANTKTHKPGKASWDFESIDFHVACTPQGCIELLDRSGCDIEGKEAVVLGRSNIVGIPVALLLMQRNATVTIAHSRTANLKEVLSRADIVIAAVGRTEMVTGDMLKPGCIVVDVGINSKDDATKKAGYRLVGDCDYDSCAAVASQITPVPGGVGPMTIAMLMRNTVNGTRRTLQAAAAVADDLPTPPVEKENA